MATSSSATQAAEADPFAVKLIIVGRRKPGTTLAEHRHHIRHVHGELVLRYIAADPEYAPRRYVQHRVFDGLFRASAPGSDPFALNRDFVTQVWAPDLATAGRARERPFYLQHVKADEDNFVDQATVVFMPARERVVHQRSGTAAAGCKLMGFVQRAGSASPEAFRNAWTAARFGATAALQRHVQNDVLGRPGAPTPLDGIDEFWLDDEASARALLTQWQAWVQESLVRPGLVAPGSAFALLMHEDVMYAGTR